MWASKEASESRRTGVRVFRVFELMQASTKFSEGEKILAATLGTSEFNTLLPRFYRWFRFLPCFWKFVGLGFIRSIL